MTEVINTNGKLPIMLANRYETKCSTSGIKKDNTVGLF